jgi:hypothetical protein
VVHIPGDTTRASLLDEMSPRTRLEEFANSSHFRIYPYTIPKRSHLEYKDLVRWEGTPILELFEEMRRDTPE